MTARRRVPDSLQALRLDDPTPLSGVTKKMWLLLHRGFSQLAIELGVKLLHGTVWGTLDAERGHGARAVRHVFHPEHAPWHAAGQGVRA